MNDRVIGRLREVLGRHLKLLEGRAEVPLDVKLVDLGLDSVAAINLLLDLEQTFEVSFPGSMLNAETFKTASSLGSALETLIER